MDCRKFLAKNDLDRYRLSLFQTKEVQKTYWILAAFDIEIASIEQKVTDPHIRTMRYQWWCEELVQLNGEGESLHHPLLQSLRQRGLKSEDLIEWIMIRESWTPYETLEDLMMRALQYTDYYWRGMNQLNKISQALKVHLIAYHMMSQMRMIFYKAVHGYILLPKKYLKEFKVKEKDFIIGNLSKPLETLLEYLRDFLDQSIQDLNFQPEALKTKTDRRLALHLEVYQYYRDQLKDLSRFYAPHFINPSPKLPFHLFWKMLSS